MKREEKELFKDLCNFKTRNFDESLLEYATPSVLGHLFFNRMQAIAYGTLKERGMLGKVNREFRNSLKAAYEQNKEKNQSFFWCIQNLKNILSECSCSYAMLKGAFLCRYYPDGYRTSNDIDLLVLPEHVTEIGNALLKAGFQQGNIRNGEFIPATRKEIIESKMMRGETIPYIKKINLPGMKYLEVDINFSLDYKNGDTKALEQILGRVQNRKVGRISVPTLDCADFFVHLCSHLYKEATTLPWVEMKRDIDICCDTYTMNVGDTTNLSYDIYPSDATDKSVVWCSSNPNVAEVNTSTGKVIAKSIGSTLITVTTNDGCFVATAFVGVEETKIYQTENTFRYKGDGTLAEDLEYNDISAADLKAMDWINWSDFAGTDAESFRDSWEYMCTSLFSTEPLQTVILDMIDHFMLGSATEYSHETLTEKVLEHTSTQNYIEAIKNCIIE